MTAAGIEAFLTVCECKSFSLAAERLFISQSSMSTKIKTLETELGYALFLRKKGSHAVVLTQEGKAFYGLAVQYRQIVEQMLALRSQRKQQKLRVGSINSIGTHLMGPVYDAFMRQYPHIALDAQDMDTDLAYHHIENGSTDLAFTTGYRFSGKVTAQKAFSEPMVFVCSARSDYPEVVGPSCLQVKNEVLVDWSLPFVQWHAQAFPRQEAPRIQLAIMGQLPFFLRQPDSWAIVPVSVARALLESGGIEQRQMDLAPPDRVTYCLSSAEAQGNETVALFLGCLQEALRELEPDGLRINA